MTTAHVSIAREQAANLSMIFARHVSIATSRVIDGGNDGYEASMLRNLLARIHRDGAQNWCTENHCGQWLTWPATLPEIIPPTPEQAAELAAAFKWRKLPDKSKGEPAPNVAHEGP